LPYGPKFLLVGLLLLTPSAYALRLLITDADSRIQSDQRERAGIEILSPAFNLLGQAELTRLRRLQGDPQASPSALQLQIERVDEIISVLDALNERHRERLRALGGTSIPGDTWRDIKMLWGNPLVSRPELFAGSTNAHNVLSATTATWIVGVASATHLVLESNLEGYWLMDALVMKLPTIVESIGRATAITLAENDGSGTETWQSAAAIDLAGLYTNIGRLLAEATVSLRTAYDTNSTQDGQLAVVVDPFVRRATNDTQTFLYTVQAGQVAATRPPAADILRPAIVAIQSLLALHEVLAPALDAVVLERLDALEATKTRALLAAGIAAALLVYVFVAFYLSMQRSVTSLRRFTARMIAGTRETFRLDTRDELGSVAEMYNDINVTLTNVRSLQNDLETQTADLTKANDTLVLEMAERQRLETQLVQAQKLESIGQLAAGIAHEINTPTQYIGDNLQFVRDGFLDIARVLDADAGAEATAAIDTPYLRSEIPKALDQALDGIRLIAEIVRAMKEFSHPDAREREPVDLNRAIIATTTVARNEWKYVAELVTDLDPDLPPVLCFAGQLNQAILNIVVNGAHAIGERNRDLQGAKGTITVSTRRDGDWVEIRISDTGGGIPEAIRDRIFDPFFTTKEVGKGTGQGLAIAYDVVIAKHQGELRLESEVGHGTTFILRLPIEGTPANSQSTYALAGCAA
jgi:signal transduction histidine kinase